MFLSLLRGYLCVVYYKEMHQEPLSMAVGDTFSIGGTTCPYHLLLGTFDAPMENPGSALG